MLPSTARYPKKAKAAPKNSPQKICFMICRRPATPPQVFSSHNFRSRHRHEQRNRLIAPRKNRLVTCPPRQGGRLVGSAGASPSQQSVHEKKSTKIEKAPMQR